MFRAVRTLLFVAFALLLLSTNLYAGTVTIQASGFGTTARTTSGSDTTFTGKAADSILTVTGLQEALRWGNVTVASSGDIVVNGNITWPSGYSLTLIAQGRIIVRAGASIANTGNGSLALRPGRADAGMISISGMIDFSSSTGRVTVAAMGGAYESAIRTNTQVANQVATRAASSAKVPTAGPVATTTQLTSSLNASRYGQPVTFTALLTAFGGGAVTGNVDFSSNIDGSLGSVAANAIGAATATVALGGAHTCGITDAGGLKCWGYNAFGQLGDTTTTTRAQPVAVNGLTSGVTAVALGLYHSCVVTSAGGVKCWGYNGYGQIGDNTTTQRTSPTNVSGFASGAIAVSLGAEHTCALTTGYGVKCWGNNGSGQLGDGTITNRSTPTDVSGLSGGITAVSSGGHPYLRAH